MSKFISDSIYYTITTYVLQIALFFINIVTKQILGPMQLGSWAFVQIILMYLLFIDLGVVDAGWKEITISHSKGEKDKVKENFSVMFGYSLLTSLPIALLLLIFEFLFVKDSNTFWGFVYLILAFPFVRFNNCFISYFRAVSEFKLLSRFNMLSMINNALFGIILVYFYGLIGMYIAAFLNVLLLTILWVIVYLKKNKLTLNINLKSYSPLLKIGIPLFMGGVSFTIFRSIDSLFVKHFLGNETLGYYNLGYSLAGYVFIIPNSLSVVLFSKFHEIYFSNKNQSNTVIFKKADEIQKVLGFMILPILIGAVYFFCDFVIVKMAPKFIPNLNLIKIMVLGIFPLSLIHVPNQLLITQNKFKYYILVGLGSNIFLISCLFGIRIYFNIGPSLVAIITSISYGVYFIVLYIVVFHKTHKWLLTVVCYILFYAYFVCVAVIISNLNLFENYQLLYRVILNFILFMFSMIPFLFYFESRIKLIKKTLTPYLKKNG